MKTLVVGFLRFVASVIVATIALIAFGFEAPLPATAHAVFWGAFALAFAVLWARPSLMRKRAAMREIRDLETLIAKHQQALMRNWRKSVKRNEYGYESREGWSKEIERFLKSTEFKPSVLSSEEIHNLMTDKVQSLADDPSG